MRVSMSLWSLDQARLADDVERYAPLVDSFHVDVIDGRFAKDLLFGPLTVRVLRRLTDKPIVVHLMVVDPLSWVPQFVEAGADTLAFHPSACANVGATVDTIRRSGAAPAVAVGLDETDRPAVEHIDELTAVFVMATAVGVKGQPFDDTALGRVRRFVDARGGRAGPAVFVDGGIRSSSIARIAAAGADGVVAGSIVAAADRPAQVVAEMTSM